MIMLAGVRRAKQRRAGEPGSGRHGRFGSLGGEEARPDVLVRVGTHPASRVDELVPANFLKELLLEVSEPATEPAAAPVTADPAGDADVPALTRSTTSPSVGRLRSLDGVRPLKGETYRTGAECVDRPRCVPQILLDLIVDARPFRMLLAHSSARAFLLYEAELRLRNRHLEDVVIRITVLNRGSWGELSFAARD